MVRATSQLKRGESGTKKASGKRVLNQERVVKVFNDGQETATVEVVETIPTGEGWNMEVTPTMGGIWDLEKGEVRWPNVPVPPQGSWEAEVAVRITLPKGANVVGL